MKEKNELYGLLPGLGQGITRVTISYPFDVIKVQMQKLYFNNMKDTFTDIVKNDPFKFYRGSSISYITVGLERSIQFYYLEKFNEKKINPILSSFGMSLFSSIYNIPVQYITTNIAITKNPKETTYNYIKKLLIDRTNIYKGFTIETPKNILGSTIFLSSYYSIRNHFGDNKYLSPFYGAFSGIILWSVIFPIDTIRTEYQTSNNKIIDIIKNRYYNYGLKSFYRGISSIYIRTIPSTSLGMFVYEMIRNNI